MENKEERYKKLSDEVNELGSKDPKAAAAKAMKIAESARKSGDDAYTLFFKGEAAYYEGNLEEARELEKKAHQLNPNIVFILSNYACVAANLNYLDEAISLFDKALTIKPESEHALFNKGGALSRLERDEEALEFFDKALIINPQNKYALSQKGVSLSKLNRFEDAEKCFDAALAIDPQHTHALRNKGAILAARGHFPKALEYYEKSKGIIPWNSYDLYWLADIYVGLNNLDKAEETARQLIDFLDKDSKSTIVAQFKLNSILEKKGQKPPKRPEEKKLDEFMTKVMAHFGIEKLDEFVQEVEAKEEDFNQFIELSKPSQKIKRAPKTGFLSVLRKWNSFTPVMTLDVEESKGGGYFLYLDGKGIVIDPGFDFVRNFFQESFKISDIDYIFITHAHMDHMADLETLFSLLYEANKRRKDPKKIDIYLNLGAMKKLAGWLTLREKYIHRIHVLEEGKRFKVGNLTIIPTRAKHSEVIDEIYSLGFVFETNEIRIGFTGDTGWELDGAIADPFKKCLILVAHLGSILRQEIEDKKIEERLYKNHLGLLGMSGMIGKAKPELCLISEFGEELGDLRGKIADGLEVALNTKCIATDIGTEIDFSSPPKVRCATCGKFSNKYHRKFYRSLLHYVCDHCNRDERLGEKQQEYHKGKRWELWDKS